MEENMVIENEATEVVEETKKESGVVLFAKKHWKKIVTVGAMAVSYFVGREMGKRSVGCDCDSSDIVDADFTVVDTDNE